MSGAVTTVGESANGPLVVFPALALGLLVAAFAVPALRPRGAVTVALAEHRLEIAMFGFSLLVAWALVALL